jgi:multicomponent Na+:H+ antiporter subunit B
MIPSSLTLWLSGVVFISVIILSISTIFSNHNLIRVLAFSSLSFIICTLYLLLDAPDVALTEAAIGACLTGVIMTIYITKLKDSGVQTHSFIRIFAAILATIAVFAFFVRLEDILPEFGSSNTPLSLGVSKYFIENTESQIGIPSLVAAILASYRGFDTLGETLVILIAGIAVTLIFGIRDAKK